MNRSFRTLRIIAALERAGHTNVQLRWVPVTLGTSCGYFFSSDQQATEQALGYTHQVASAQIESWRLS